MKARVFRIFKDKKHTISYNYVDVAKCHDDMKSMSHEILCTPMMEIRLWKDDGSLEDESITVFASPEVVEKYTGFDIFNLDCYYSLYGDAIDIDFEWVERDYPYIKLWDKRDYILGARVKFPQINEIKDSYHTFIDSLD